MTATETEATLTEGLADLLRRRVGTQDRAKARMHLLDWVGTVIAALETEEGRILREFAGSRSSGPATTLGVGRQSLDTALLVNAGLGMVLELDDVHRGGRLHPGPVVIPVSLALAEQKSATFGALLDAIVRGYEAMIRVGESVGEEHYRYWHNTSSCGTFGAAAAAASLINLGRDQMVHALGNAGTQSAGLWQCRPERTMSKPLHAGRAAQAGVDAASLAALGLTGPKRILEGPLGFYAATCPDADPSLVTGGDSQWRIHSTSLKPWHGCRHVHPAMDAASRLNLGVESLPPILRIEVRTYTVATEFADLATPTTPQEAKFSLQHAVATAMVAYQPALARFDQPAIADPVVERLRALVDVSADARFDSRYPAHWGAEVVVHTPSGMLAAEVQDALGDPEHPMPQHLIEDKARFLIPEGSGFDAEDIINRLSTASDDEPASEVLGILQQAP